MNSPKPPRPCPTPTRPHRHIPQISFPLCFRSKTNSNCWLPGQMILSQRTDFSWDICIFQISVCETEKPSPIREKVKRTVQGQKVRLWEWNKIDFEGKKVRQIFLFCQNCTSHLSESVLKVSLIQCYWKNGRKMCRKIIILGRPTHLFLGSRNLMHLFPLKKEKQRKERKEWREEGRREAERERGKKEKGHSWLGTMSVWKPNARIICYFQSH